MIATNQHKKQLLIFNWNMFDLSGPDCSIHGETLQHPSDRSSWRWLCIILISENLLCMVVNGAQINLMSITIERYVKWFITKAAWSKSWQRYCHGSAVLYTTWLWSTGQATWRMESAIGMRSGPDPLPHLDTAFCICFTLCILVVIRRQARVMASHSEPGPSTFRENQSHQIQTNVIKTMVIVSAFFVITWAPGYVFFMLQHITPSRRMYLHGYYVPLFLVFSTSLPTYSPTPLSLIQSGASWCV